MKRFVCAFCILLLGLPSSAHAWFFFFIPGSAVSGVSDAFSGAKGNMCVKEGIEVGHVFTASNGNTAKVLSLSGTASMCQNPAQPIRAEIAFSYAFSSKAGIELSDDFKAGTLSDFDRYSGFLLKVTSSSVADHGIQIDATTKNSTRTLQSIANSLETVMRANPKFKNVSSMNAETLTINGNPAVRFELAATLKGVFDREGVFIHTLLEGDNEIVDINVYAPRDYADTHREELQGYAYKVSGLSAKPQEVAAPINTPAQAAAPSSISPDERLQQLNKMLKSGLITKGEYEVKKKEILKNL